MANFIDININQTVFLDINYLDQLGTDNFDFYLYSLLNKPHFLDDFLNSYKNHAVGRKAYPPELLLRIIFCAYYRDITSNRVIASLCVNNYLDRHSLYIRSVLTCQVLTRQFLQTNS